MLQSFKTGRFTNFAHLNNIFEFKCGKDLLGFNFEWYDWEVKKKEIWKMFKNIKGM
jgi:hypothetical protein